jgi:hypothetical protein
VFKGALARFRYKKIAYTAKHGDYLGKIIKVQAFQRGRVVRKQVAIMLLFYCLSPHYSPYKVTISHVLQAKERRRNARLKQLAVRMFKQAEFRCFNMWRSAWNECKYVFSRALLFASPRIITFCLHCIVSLF